MISKRLTNISLSIVGVLLSVVMANAQTFNGNIINTAGNGLIPSAGTGGCTIAPQTTGGTNFLNAVAGLTNQVPQSVTVNFTHTFDADLDIFLVAPNGEILELSTDNGGAGDNYTNTVFSDGAATNITAGVAPFTGNFLPEGTLTASACGVTTTPTVARLCAFTGGQNGNWQLRIFDDVGGDTGTMLNWSITFGPPPCGFVAASLPLLTLAGTNPAFCGFQGNVTAPTLNGQCAPGTLMNVTIDGVAAGTVASGATFAVSLSSGNHVIVYSVPPCASITQNVTVTDGIGPTITCPANMQINLDPGACSAVVNFDVTAVDNCPFYVNAAPLVFPQTLLAHGGGAITVAGNNLPGGNFFNLTNTGTAPVRVTGYRVRFGSFTFGNVPSPQTVNTYISVGNTFVGQTGNAAGWTSTGVASVTVAGANSELSQVNLTTPYFLNPGETKGVYLFGVNASLVYNAAAGFTANIAQGPFNLTSGASSQGLFGAIIANRTPNVEIQYQVQGPVPVTQYSGLASGSEFPIGTTTNCFRATDFAGNQTTCCFNINVIEYPNPIASLVCNDLVYVSLDQDCTFCLGADGVLEGGPYHCYDDYIVEVDKTLPYGNGPWVPACFGPADLGKTYQVRVTDPDTGNKCWGNVKIEDKLPPVLTCCDYSLPCNADPTPIFGSADLIANAKGSSFPINDLQTTQGTANVGACVGATIQDVNLSLNIAHTWIGDLRIELTSPAGTTMVVWANNCGATDNIIHNFDDEAANCYTLCTDYGVGNTGRPLACAAGTGTTDFLSKFDGENPAGNWTLRIRDGVGGDQGVVTAWSLNIAYNSPSGTAPIVDENCGTYDLEYIDSEIPQDCASGNTRTIVRKWTATDSYGNVSTCQQNISMVRPTLDDVVAPPDYDGIDAPAFSCEQSIPLLNGHPHPTPDWIEGQGLQGYPYVFGLPSGCNINWEWHDYPIEVCDGTIKYRREWTIIDWCTGSGFIYEQILKVLDETGPAFQCPANMTVSTDAFTCCATINLPDVIVEDNCSRINNISGMIVVREQYTGEIINMVSIGGSLQDFPGNNHWDLDTLANFGWAPCLPIGTHQVTYIAEDDCGNTSSCQFNLTVRDFIPPVASCDETTTVAIGVDDPFDCYGPAGPNDVPPALDACSFAGVTWVKASVFNDGSYDNCNNVKFTVRRMQPYSDCILALNSVRGFAPCDSPFPTFPSEFERAISEQDSIKFYCCEVG
ncbi:MAG TPA: proprotein convertase P-domain-containing protein, partial [Saprospiraceae bacterium]|nr:proprotein convertase P-domain-containing protein [Saprospiraceae bacterium]